MTAKPVYAVDAAVRICRSPSREAHGASIDEIKAMSKAVCDLWSIVADTADLINAVGAADVDDEDAQDEITAQMCAIADMINCLRGMTSNEENNHDQ